MWKHECPVDGPIEVGDGEECNWCGAKEQDSQQQKEEENADGPAGV